MTTLTHRPDRHRPLAGPRTSPPSGAKARVAASIARKHLPGRRRTARHRRDRAQPDDWSVDLDSAAVRGAGANAPTIVLHRPDEFFAPDRRRRPDRLRRGLPDRRVGRSTDLGRPAHRVRRRDRHPGPAVGCRRLRALYVARTPRTERNTQRPTRGNIAAPLRPVQRPVPDLPRPDAELLLRAVRRPRGDRPAYAEATAPTAVPAVDLEAAQGRKIERLLDQAGVGAGTRVLEIGTGWGELAIRAARRGATVALGHPVQRAAGAGRRADRGRRLRRPRSTSSSWTTAQVTGRATTPCVSVEMIEAVGHEYWPTYFETIDRVLAPGGKVAIQAITMPHDRMLATRSTPTRGSTSTSSPAASCPRCEAIERDHPRAHRAAGHRPAVVRPALRRDAAAVGRARSWPRRDRVRALGFDEIVRADVALLPGVLARRLRLGLPRRQPDRPQPKAADDLRR